MNDHFAKTQAQKISAEIAALSSLCVTDLKLRWRALYDTEPPSRISRELLTRAVVHRLQESAFGAVDPATRQLLARFEERSERRAQRIAAVRQASPGTLLIREWQGQAYQVTMLDDAVSYRGERYGSLSEVARLITGTRWSGPLFFGLRKPTGEAHDGAN